jgi:hypothetical protein
MSITGTTAITDAKRKRNVAVAMKRRNVVIEVCSTMMTIDSHN